MKEDEKHSPGVWAGAVRAGPLGVRSGVWLGSPGRMGVSNTGVHIMQGIIPGAVSVVAFSGPLGY